MATSRSPQGLAHVSKVHQICDSTDVAALRTALKGVDFVIHLAARTHVMDDQSTNPLEEYRRINVHGTKALSKAATEAGVKRLIFLSSIKVNGEQTTFKPYTASDTPAPEDAYGLSKAEAEEHLKEVGAKSNMEIVIIRTPLVYGPGVRANFLSLMSLANRSVPLPFGAITQNRRSLIYIENLVAVLIAALEHKEANRQTFLVRDGEDFSTASLVQKIRTALNKPARLISFPAAFLRVTLTAMGKKDMANRLLGSLAIDDQATRNLLGWTPPISAEEGLRRTVDWYLTRDENE